MPKLITARDVLVPRTARAVLANDAARKFPSYTLADLEKMVAEGKGNAAILEEIAARKAGTSEARVTPQILGGKVQTKLGRM